MNKIHQIFTLIVITSIIATSFLFACNATRHCYKRDNGAGYDYRCSKKDPGNGYKSMGISCSTVGDCRDK